MADFRIGVVGLPGKWSTEVLADAVEAHTGFRLVIDMQAVSLDLASQTLIYAGQDICDLDALIIKKIAGEYSPATLDRLELLRVAEAKGVRVFSGAEKILRLIDRLSCTVSLRNAGIPMPETVVTEDVETAYKTVGNYGEAVFKPLYSTKARGMCVIKAADGEAQVRKEIRKFQNENQMMYIQKKKDLKGQDFGMVFLGGEYLGSYARVTGGDSWNTTIHHGGKYMPYEATPELIKLGYRAQVPFKMDFTTVDVAITEEGPVIFEVSAFGGFRGAKEGIGIDAAGRYADYVMERLGEARGD
ncbi:GAK system ATP-grasp enzyme [Pseudomonadota bacterium]